MTITWTEVAPFGPIESGDIGGDEQFGEAYGRRFAASPDDEGNIPLLTISFYVANENYNDNDGEPDLFLRRHVEYMLCTDLGDPGGTEQWRDYAYLTEPTTGVLDDATAREACASMPLPTEEAWNGERWHDVRDAPFYQ